MLNYSEIRIAKLALLIISISFYQACDKSFSISINSNVNEEMLIMAAGKGDFKTVSQLLKRGVSINAHEPDFGTTALISAANNGRVNIVELLLDKGAKVDDTDKSGVTALIAATKAKSLPCMNALLLAGADPNLNDAYKNTPLLEAIDGNIPEAVTLLLQKGANPNKVFHEVPTALEEAVLKKNPDIFKLLLNHGADPSLCPGGEGGLMSLAHHTSPDIEKLLKDSILKKKKHK